MSEGCLVTTERVVQADGAGVVGLVVGVGVGVVVGVGVGVGVVAVGVEVV
jgi:glycine cleavage system aminomethyltransferase T